MRRLVAAAVMLIAGCGERDEPLPNGYRFIELSRGTGAIAKDGNFAVYPNIIEYRVRGGLVFGKRIFAYNNTNGSAPFVTGLGYFTLDTVTGHVSQELPISSSPNGS